MIVKLSFLILFIFTLGNINGQTFKAGAALRIITPKNLIPSSGGMGTPEMPTGV